MRVRILTLVKLNHVIAIIFSLSNILLIMMNEVESCTNLIFSDDINHNFSKEVHVLSLS